jgi:23S rRNA pseudouridine1911/1915/1917 synthase
MQRVWTVEVAEAGQRLDEHLAQRLQLSRAAARRLIQQHAVQLGERSRPHKGERIEAGATVRVQTAIESPMARADLALCVLEEGDGWVAVDKPSGWGVHPLRPTQQHTVLNAALARWPELVEVGEGGLRGGIVHRLDVETSGVLLLARDARRYAQLRAAFHGHRVEKLYLAWVEGDLQTDLDLTLDLYMAQRRPARVGIATAEQTQLRGRRSCRTRLQPLLRCDGRTLVEVRPVSGYLHQIRATLAHLGHPVVGDAHYGRAGTRLLLHARRIVVPELEIDASSPMPPEFDLTG